MTSTGSSVYNQRTNFYKYSVRQKFALPDSIMNYISKNPTKPRVYKNLVESCKYFFHANPILVVPGLFFEESEWRTITEDLNLSKTCSRIWPWGEFNMFSTITSDNTSSILPRIYKIDCTKLLLHCQILSDIALKTLASKANSIELHNVKVIGEDDEVLNFEQIVELIPNATFYDCDVTGIVNTQTVQKLLKLDNFHLIRQLILHNVGDSFDLENFYNFLKITKMEEIWIKFAETDNEAFKTRVETIVDEINDGGFDYTPYISFPGLDEVKENRMKELFDRNHPY